MDISLSELTNSFQTRRARWRLRQRRASILVLPSACFLAELSRWGMAAALGDGDAVKGAVELTVAAAIEAVADAVARGVRRRIAVTSARGTRTLAPCSARASLRATRSSQTMRSRAPAGISSS